MKKFSIITLVLATLSLAACSEYLNTAPTSSTATATIFENTENAALAVNGLNRLMYCQYNDYGQGFNGEGTIRLYMGEYPGDKLMSCNQTGWKLEALGEQYDNNRDDINEYAWYYYYMVISNANSIISNIDAAEGPEADRKFIKAQALTYRAYCYSNLVQLFGRRWSDNNGDTPSCVLRLIAGGEDNLDRAKTKDVYAQIYQDLDDAITLFTESGKANKRGADVHKMDLDVAYAIYARVALTREDWQKALDMAKLARANYPLMSVADYNKGFCNPTSESIWSLYNVGDETIYYYSFFGYIAYNSNAGNVRQRPKLISREFFNQINAADIRKKLFLDPTGYEDAMNKETMLASTQKTSNALYNYGFAYGSADGRKGLYSTAYVAGFMQFKFACNEAPGVGHLTLFRSSEMLLIEAEANYRLNKPADAQAALVALNATSGRYPGYTCTLTGEALMNEIKLYRGIELWGEGFTWFDLKRWGDTIVRKDWANGGSWMADFLGTVPPTKHNWTWIIPQRETDYNKGILSTSNE